MRKNDILRDKSIKTVAVESIDKDFNDIKVVGSVEESGLKSALHYIRITLVTVLLCALVFIGVYIYVNMHVVVGHVDGATANIGSISLVDRNYNPVNLVKEGSTIYYDPKFQGDQFIARDTDFSIANVTSVTSDKVYIASEGREVSIAKSRIRYVVSR